MWIAVSLLIAVVTLIWYSMKPFYWSNHNIPYLIPLPLFGNCVNLLKYGNIDYFKYLHSQFPGKPYFGMHFFTRPTLYIKDPEIVRKIFATSYDHFTSRGFYSNQDRDAGGGNMFHLWGQQWKDVRGKVSPYFTPGKIRIMLECTYNTLPKLFQRIDTEIDKGNPIELTSLFRITNINIITQAIFGTESDSFENTNSIFTELANLTFHFMFTARIFISTVSSKLYNLFNFTIFGKRLNDMIRKIVEKSIENRDKENITRQDFLQGMMDLMKTKSTSDGEYYPDHTRVPKYDLDTITSQSIVLYIGGTETSALTLTYLLYELAVNPEIQERCRAEIKSVAQHCPVTLEDTSGLVYLSAVIDEVLRIYSVFTFVSRECTKAFTFPDSGITIEPGTYILASPVAFQMDEQNFTEPNIFRPERFLQNGKNQIKPGTYFPFGLGPKSCVGSLFALKNIKVIISCLLQRYQFHVTTKTQIPIKLEKFSFHPTPENGLWLKLSPLVNYDKIS